VYRTQKAEKNKSSREYVEKSQRKSNFNSPWYHDRLPAPVNLRDTTSDEVLAMGSARITGNQNLWI